MKIKFTSHLLNHFKTTMVMKKMAILLLSAVIIMMSAFVSKSYIKSGAQGKIDPADGAKEVWAISNSDSVSVVPQSGNFSLDLKPGKWKIHVVAIAPLKDAFVNDVIVQDGKYTDVGEIKLVGDIH